MHLREVRAVMIASVFAFVLQDLRDAKTEVAK